MRAALVALAILFCSLPVQAFARPGHEALYFSVEVRQGGKLLAQPKLLGEEGKPLFVERRQQGAQQFDYRFSLLPKRDGTAYQVDFNLQLPTGEAHSELALGHAKPRILELGHAPGDLQVSLLLLRVDSQEFRELMSRAAPSPARVDEL